MPAGSTWPAAEPWADVRQSGASSLLHPEFPFCDAADFRDAAVQAPLDFSPATARVLEAFQPPPVSSEPVEEAGGGPRMTHDEWGVLHDVLRPEVSYEACTHSAYATWMWRRDEVT